MGNMQSLIMYIVLRVRLVKHWLDDANICTVLFNPHTITPLFSCDTHKSKFNIVKYHPLYNRLLWGVWNLEKFSWSINNAACYILYLYCVLQHSIHLFLNCIYSNYACELLSEYYTCVSVCTYCTGWQFVKKMTGVKRLMFMSLWYTMKLLVKFIVH